MFSVEDLLKNNFNKSALGNSTFFNYLKSKWNEIHESNDVFRYKIDNNLEEKVLGGYLVQLNLDRNTKRRQPESIERILLPFDKDKFNFTKANTNEVICTLKDNHDSDIHSILVNVSPVSRYHSLLCPSVNKCLPQVATEESLRLAIQLMFCAGDRALRIAFNSLCGFASVNHLHYHFFVDEHILPAEIAKCDHVQGPVYCLTKAYHIQGFCFEIVSENMAEAISKEIQKLVKHLLNRYIAHNIFMTKGSSVSGFDGEVLRVLVWPRRSSGGMKPSMTFNVAAVELSGWFTVYDADAYKNLQTTDLESELHKWSIDDFESLCKEIKELY